MAWFGSEKKRRSVRHVESSVPSNFPLKVVIQHGSASVSENVHGRVLPSASRISPRLFGVRPPSFTPLDGRRSCQNVSR